ncbi:MAG: hypothetical protein J5J06_02180 [Phycisphaerae bacterium]|nr:hypothetical protein [Phycisphaerae bacterium]
MQPARFPAIALIGAWTACTAADFSAARAQTPEEAPSASRSAERADREGRAEAGRSAGDSDADAGLWPSPKLTRLMLTRWADDISEQYDLDADQRTEVREMVIDRWGSFLEEHRATIRPLLNEYLELRMEIEPPPKEKVQDWAKRAMPVFEQFREQISEGSGDFRKVLTPMQRVKFEVDALQFNVGLTFAEKQLRDYASGEFKPEDFWIPHGERFRRERSERRREEREEFAEAVQKAQAETPPPDQIELELARWDEYVATFIREHQLDEGQRTTVLSILSELKRRALDHRDRRKDEIVELERRIAAGSDSEPEREELKRRLVELYGPIDALFAELQERLRAVLTAEQRAKEQEAKAAPASESLPPPG